MSDGGTSYPVTNITPPLPHWVVQARLIAGATSILVGILVLLGWAIDNEILKSVIPGLVAMKANTAVVLVFLGVTVMLSEDATRPAVVERRLHRLIALACAGFVVLFSALIASQYFLGRDFGVDQFFFTERANAIGTSAPGRMALPTTLVMIILGTSFFINRPYPRLAHAFMLISAAGGILGLAVYAYGTPYRGEVPQYTQMALHTAIGLTALAFGALTTLPTRGLVAILASNGYGGMLARRLLPTALLAPFALSVVFLLGKKVGLYHDATVGTALATANVIIFAGLVMWLARRIDAADAERQAAEQAISRRDNRYRALVKHSSDMVTVIGCDGLRTYVSPSIEARLGYHPDELVGNAALSLVHPDDLDLTRELVASLHGKPGATASGIHRLLHRNGDVVWVDAIVANLSDDPDVAGIVITSRDITERRQIEEALSDSEAQARRDSAFAQLLIDSSFDAISALDIEERYIAWNPGMERLIGVPKEEVLGKRATEVFPWLEETGSLALMRRALAGEVIIEHDRPYNIPVLGRSGYTTIQMTPLRDESDGIIGMLSVAHETTERRRSQQALAEQAHLLELAHDAVIVREPDGTILSWNRGAEEMYGYAREQAIGQIIHEFLQTEAPLSIDEMQAELTRDNRWDGELIHRHQNGSRLVVASRQVLLRDDQGNPLRILAINSDITAQKEAAEQLVVLNQELEQRVADRTAALASANQALEAEILEREQAQERLLDGALRYRFLANTMPQLVWTTRSDGSIDYVNQPWYDYTGLSFDQSQTDAWQEIIHPDDWDRVAEAWTAAFELGRGFDVEYRLKRAADDTYRWHLGRTAPRRDRDGQIVQWVATATDIEDQKQAVAVLQRAHDDLDQRVRERTTELAESNATLTMEIAERLEVESQLREAMAEAEEASRLKSQFLSTMSHELRTPMNAIIGYAHLLLDGLDGPLTDEQTADISQIARSADQLLNLINDVLDISKIEAGRIDLSPESIDLPVLVHQVCDSVRPQATTKGLALVVDIGENLPRLEADLTRLRQILINLVGNAVKFTDQGQVGVTVRAEGEVIDIAVSDTGIGISPKALDFIFDEFRQADGSTTRRFGGTGLGLAIARKLARLHGGDITVASEIGAGSVFTVRLPIAESSRTTEPISPVAPRKEPVLTEPSHEIAVETMVVRPASTVLLIEDDPAFVNLVRRTLESRGIKVIQSGRGADGLLLASAIKPSLVLLDIGLEDRIDGWQVLHRLRANPETRMLPIVIVTARDDEGNAGMLGATDYMVKPIDRNALLTALKRFGSQPPLDILIVDDDPEMRSLMTRILSPDGFVLRQAADGVEALAELDNHLPDVLILDLLMPRTDGFRVLEAVRTNPTTARLPVIVMTSLDLNAEQFAWLRRQTATVLTKSSLSTESLISEIQQLLNDSASEVLTWENDGDDVLTTLIGADAGPTAVPLIGKS